MIEVVELVKHYGERKALDGVSFAIPQGSIAGFLGPNGAGKTTSLRILCGYIAPTSGTVKIGDIDVGQEPAQAKAQIGYMPESSPLPPELRVAEYLLHRAELKAVPRSERRVRVGEVMKQTQIADVAGVSIGRLSRGYKQRVGLADALVARPKVLLLDEPTAGLDPNQIRDVRKLLKSLAGQTTIVLSTHILSEVEATCDHLIVMHRGKVVESGSLREVQGRRTQCHVWITVSQERERAMAMLRLLAEVRECGPLPDGDEESQGKEGRKLSVVGRENISSDDLAEICVEVLSKQGIKIREVRRAESRLEQAFADLTGEAS